METSLWEVIHTQPLPSGKKATDQVRDILLENRKIENSELFFHPPHPREISLDDYNINSAELEKAIAHLKIVHSEKKKVVVYGDYDVDGVCATATLWQCMHRAGFDVLPFIPNRFSDGYGMKTHTVTYLKEKYPDLSLIITVDNGIVAASAVDTARELGIDVIITDHHEPKETLPSALAIIHTIGMCGTALAWIFCRELSKCFNLPQRFTDSLIELSALGTIADQMALTGTNRSFAVWGLKQLNETKTPGLISLINSAALTPGSIGVYEVGFQIAPRINAVGRLADATEAVRLLCTKDTERAHALATSLSSLNTDRQDIVLSVINQATEAVIPGQLEVSVVVGNYHEGVIGLAAAKLVEQFNRPAIVISKGEKTSKGSARSISGLHITELIRSLDHLLIDAGGHEMAAGFSIETSQIDIFRREIQLLSQTLLTPELLLKKTFIDMELSFEHINWDLVQCLDAFQPTGMGNPNPVFLARNVSVVDKKLLGSEKQHLKLRLYRDGEEFDAIFFNASTSINRTGGVDHDKIDINSSVDVVFSVDKNIWNGKASIQLKVKALKIYDDSSLPNT